jgi:DnaJ-class molecular chaperone
MLFMIAALGLLAAPQVHAQAGTPLPPPVITAPKAVVKQPPAATTTAKPKAVWCPSCRGRKTVGVDAEVNCRSCNGTGKITTGFTKTETACNFCKGTGKVINIVQQQCPVCQAKGVLDAAVFEQFIGCTNCTGQKVVELDTQVSCNACLGAGKIVKAGGSSFGSSGGFGSRGGKSGASVSSAPQEQPCQFCNGTGKVDKRVTKACPTCYGAGVIAPPPPPPEPKPE